jgi:hypothetical protein
VQDGLRHSPDDGIRHWALVRKIYDAGDATHGWFSLVRNGPPARLFFAGRDEGGYFHTRKIGMAHDFGWMNRKQFQPFLRAAVRSSNVPETPSIT